MPPLCGSASAAVMVLLATAGCSGSPPPPKRADLAPADVARRAIEQYDANHDGKIDAAEIEKSPALAAMAAAMNSQPDGTLSEDQIAQRAAQWLKEPCARVSHMAVIDLDGQPLQGATVTFEPEECMGPAYHASTAVTDQAGQCFPPGDDPTYPGLSPGLYRIRVSKLVDGRETVPARYNAQTELGVEATAASRHGAFLPLHLQSR